MALGSVCKRLTCLCFWKKSLVSFRLPTASIPILCIHWKVTYWVPEVQREEATWTKEQERFFLFSSWNDTHEKLSSRVPGLQRKHGPQRQSQEAHFRALPENPAAWKELKASGDQVKLCQGFGAWRELHKLLCTLTSYFSSFFLMGITRAFITGQERPELQALPPQGGATLSMLQGHLKRGLPCRGQGGTQGCWHDHRVQTRSKTTSREGSRMRESTLSQWEGPTLWIRDDL